MNLFDRALAAVSPELGLRRARARAGIAAHERVAQMNYDAATPGRRASSLRANAGDADLAAARRARLAYISRDMIRNSPFAVRAQTVIANNVVGDGIVPGIVGSARAKKRGMELIRAHLDTVAIDADGLNNLYGLQRLAMNCIVDSGEVLIRRRRRRLSDGLPMPFQIQVMEPDFLDTRFDGRTPAGNTVREGIEYDDLGRRVAYHLFRHHPGAVGRFGAFLSPESRRVPASEVLHVFRQDRPGQMRGVSWYAPVALKLQDNDDHLDAQLMRQKIAACFAAFIYADDPDEALEDQVGATLAPGAIQTIGTGKKIEFSKPPGVEGFDAFTATVLRSIAAGMGITYESLVGDLSQVNYSSARMGRLEMDRNVSSWQWLMMIPRMMAPFAGWFLEAWEALEERPLPAGVGLTWTPPRRVIVDPSKEIKAMGEEVRHGFRSRQAVVRSLGYDPEEVDREIAEDNARADELGLVLDSDPRKGKAGAEPAAAAAPAAEDGSGSTD